VSAVVRAFFTSQGRAIGTLANALVWAEEWESYGMGANYSRHVAVLFRVRNNTGGDIVWPVSWYRTSSSTTYDEYASIALNGADVWATTAVISPADTTGVHNITIPKSRTSTVIFVAGTTNPSSYSRSLMVGFYNNGLTLPNGLEFVDDLDTKPDGWTN